MTQPIIDTNIEETSATTRKVGYFLGPLLFAITILTNSPEGMDANAWRVCGLAMWMACWWVTEAMPLPVSSLLPLAVLPVATTIPFKNVGSPYASSIIFLFLGGFMLSIAMEKWNLHMRIGLSILKVMGKGAKSILGGMMIATALLGMWISNTATAIMMLPMAISMATLFSKENTPMLNNNFAKAMILGVAYSCVAGGMSTFVGSPANAVLIGHMQKTYNFEFNLSDWMTFGIPMTVAMLAIMWSLLSFIFLRGEKIDGCVKTAVGDAYAKLGPMQREEKIVCLAFATAALLWSAGSYIEKALGITLDDAGIAIFAALLLFLIPTNKRFDQFALTWKDTAKLPWGILVFFGGSLCLSQSLTDSGVTTWLSGKLSMLEGMNLIVIVTVVVLLMIFVSEMMSNVATITAFLPILSAMAAAMGVNPLIVLLPATLAASCGFMLPGASAPNAFAYGTGFLRVKDLIRTGLLLDLAVAALVVICTFTLVSWVFQIDPYVIPEWALK